MAKCLNARPKTKEKGIDIILMYIEIEKQDVVQVREVNACLPQFNSEFSP